MKRIAGLFAGIAIAISLIPTKTIVIEPSTPPFDNRAALIDQYFHKKQMPLEGEGLAMVQAADQDRLDWRLLPALSVRESSGGLQACGANPFGWNSCKSTFPTVEAAIAAVAANLGGNVTGTRAYYAGKGTYEKLVSYNGTVIPTYPQEVLNIMDSIYHEESNNSKNPSAKL